MALPVGLLQHCFFPVLPCCSRFALLLRGAAIRLSLRYSTSNNLARPEVVYSNYISVSSHQQPSKALSPITCLAQAQRGNAHLLGWKATAPETPPGSYSPWSPSLSHAYTPHKTAPLPAPAAQPYINLNIFCFTPLFIATGLPSSSSNPAAPPSPDISSNLTRSCSSSSAMVFFFGFDAPVSAGVFWSGCYGLLSDERCGGLR